MVYKLNMLKDMLPKLVLRKDLTPKLRCDLITTCYCVVSAFVEMHKKFEDLKLIAKSKGSPPGNISTLKSEFPPRGSKELKILWRSQLLEHLFETWRDWSRVFENDSVVKHGTVLDTSSKLLRLVGIRTSSPSLHVPVQYVGIVELLVRPLVKYITSPDREEGDIDASNQAEREFYDEMESTWASSIALGFNLCVRIFRQDNPKHRIELCHSIILRSGLTDHAMLIVKSKISRRHIELIASATRILELSLSQDVYIHDVEEEKDEVDFVDETKISSQTLQSAPPGMDIEEEEVDFSDRRISSVGPQTPPGIRKSFHTGT